MRLEQWRDARRKSILQGKNAAEEVHSCQNCGAQVIIPKGEAMGKCGFCGGKFARRAFGKSDELPEVLIPFVLTEDEARGKLAEWVKKNSRKEEAQTVLANIQALRGYYLPYELIRGPVTAQVQRMETYSDRKYNMGGFLNGIAVNTSKQLDNLVLDAMEPFEWTAARPFEFAFIAGQRVKLSDVDGMTLENRVLEEVEDGFRPEAEHALQTTGVVLKMEAGHLLRLPALLPVYVLSIGPVLAVVNGQTGRVAVTKTQLIKNYSWLIEPTILTVLTTGAMCLFDVLIGLIWGAIFGIIFFVAFADGILKSLQQCVALAMVVRIVNDMQGVRKVVGRPLPGLNTLTSIIGTPVDDDNDVTDDGCGTLQHIDNGASIVIGWYYNADLMVVHNLV